jgi:hypothetical protein
MDLKETGYEGVKSIKSALYRIELRDFVNLEMNFRVS